MRLTQSSDAADFVRDGRLPQASVVIAFRQVDAQLLLAIRSVLEQTFTSWELILLADGPTEETLRGLESVAKDARVSIRSDGLHLGLAARLNQGAQLARAPLLFRMDADDVMHPERMARQVAHLAANPECDLLGTRAYLISESDEVLGLFKEAPLPCSVGEVIRNVPFTHPTVAGRTAWFRDHPYDETFARGQDKELWARSFETTQRQKLEEPLLFYRVASRASAENYRLARASDRRVARLYGSDRGAGLLGFLLTTYVKQGIFALISLGRVNQIIRRRQSSPLPLGEAAKAQGIIASVKEVDRLPQHETPRAEVTIGIAAYNASDVVLDAIASVRSQSHRDWHLVVVDDGSSDDTLEKLSVMTDSRISVVSDGRNMGLAARLNQISRSANSDFVMRMDADDVMHPQRVEKQIAFMRENPQVHVLGTRAYSMDDFKRVRGLFREAGLGARPLDWLKVCGLSHPTVCMRTSWAKANPYDESLRRSDDLELWARTVDTSHFAKLEEPLLFYRLPRRINLRNYRADKITERLVVRRVSRSIGLGWGVTSALLIKSWVQERVMVLAVATRADSFLQARKTSTLDSSRLFTAQQELRSALACRNVAGEA